MADTTSEVAALKADKAKLDAEKDLLKSQLEKLQAERALRQAQGDTTTAGAKGVAETQKLLADAAKARADAETAAAAAEIAALKAKLGAGTIAGTSLGTTTVGTSAGNFESSLLAAKAINDAADMIKTKLPPPADGRRYIIFTGTQKPSFADLRLFEAKVDMLTAAYARADDSLKEADRAAAAIPKAPAPGTAAVIPRPPSAASIALGTAATGAALETLSKLGSYFQTDYSIANLTVTGADADLLALSLAGQVTKAWYPGRWPPPPPAGGVVGLFGGLPELRRNAVEQLAMVLGKQMTVAQEALDEKDAARKKGLDALANRYGAVAEAFGAANKAFDDLVAGLAETDTAGVARISRVAEQRSISDGMAGGDYALILQVGAVGGTSYTKKNLWTFFGGMPFYVSGGAVAGYMVVDKDGAVKSAGQLPLHSGYLKAIRVAARLAATRSPSRESN